MRDHSKHIELSRDQAVEGMMATLPDSFGVVFDENATPASTVNIEQVSVLDAVERVLACDMFSKIQAPNALTCCLDSIAVKWDAFDAAANADEGKAPIPDTSGWTRGVDWQFANTGIAMPEGFDTAIVIEHVEVSEDEQHVKLLAAPSARFAGTKPAGKNLEVGDCLARAGQIVTPDTAARIASGNHTVVPVVRRPRVAFIPTGNELEKPGAAEVGRGRNLETNSTLVQGKVESWGGEFVPFDIVPDSPELITRAVLDASRLADIVVLNAGSSKGSDDWSVEQLEDLGQIICHQTNHGPGHHSSYTVVEGTPIVGISGPPAGASFTLNFYLLPVMRRFLGLDWRPVRIPARLVEPFASNRFAKTVDTKKLAGEKRPPEANEPGREFFSVKFVMLEPAADGMLEVRPVAGHPGSPETLHANAFCMVPSGPGQQPPEVGSTIMVEMR